MKRFQYKLKYWFAHWCAFQLTALKLNVWSPRMLLHDWYKPYLSIIYSDNTVRKLHRKWSSHHPENGGKDYISMIVDWECSKITKCNKELSARDTMNKFYPELKSKLEPILNKLEL